jgi:uncharacterized protein involved in tolerance to divalent cations
MPTKLYTFLCSLNDPSAVKIYSWLNDESSAAEMKSLISRSHPGFQNILKTVDEMHYGSAVEVS